MCIRDRYTTGIKENTQLDTQSYDMGRGVSSVVKSDHKAVIELPSGAFATVAKTRHQRQCHPGTPSQNAEFAAVPGDH